MKNRVILLVVMMCGVLVGTCFTVVAQIPAVCPTSSTCPWTTASAPQRVYIKNPTNNPWDPPCAVDVFYCYRTCNGAQEVYIRYWLFLDLSCANGINTDDPKFFEATLQPIYMANPWNPTGVFNAPPCSENANDAYYHQVYLSSCYKTVYSGFPDPLPYLVACNPEGDCIATFKVCWNYTLIPAQLVVTRVFSNNSGATCPDVNHGIIINGQPTGCRPICPLP